MWVRNFSANSTLYFAEVQDLQLTFYKKWRFILVFLVPSVARSWTTLSKDLEQLLKKFPSLFYKQEYLKRFTHFSEVFVLNLKLWCILSYWCCGKCFGGQANLQKVLSCVKFVFKGVFSKYCCLTMSSSLSVLCEWLVKNRLRWVVVISFVSWLLSGSLCSY